MLVAKNRKGDDCLAWETCKSQAPFFCPDCREELVLKKGRIREHHFAHKAKNSCQNYVGETLIHQRCKREIYSYLKQQEKCTKCNLELMVGNFRPDICLRINDVPIVIEVQRSNIDISIIKKRTMYYSKRGIYVLWIIPHEKILKSRYSKKHEQTFFYPKSWQLFLHQMYFGRKYVWDHNSFVKPIHLQRFKYYVPQGNWVEESPEEFHNTRWYDSEVGFADYGDYEKLSTSKYEAITLEVEDNLINIVEDFYYTTRDEFINHNTWIVPVAKLWMDRFAKWW